MKLINVLPLSKDTFKKYGEYFDFVNETSHEENVDVFFEPDVLEIHSPENTFLSYAYSYPREMKITSMEAHFLTAETVASLNGDSVFFVCPSFDGLARPDLDKVEAFYVPKGVVLSLNVGVWHLAAFPVSDDPLLIICALPKETYRKDCVVVNLERDEEIFITL